MSNYYEVVKHRLQDLMEGVFNQSEDEVCKPTDWAYAKAESVLECLLNIWGDDFPLGFCMQDSRGGIDLIWRDKDSDAEVKIKIAANEQLPSYIYFSAKGDSELFPYVL